MAVVPLLSTFYLSFVLFIALIDAQDCSFTDASSGTTFDLSGLRLSGAYYRGTDSTHKYQYDMNVCAIVPDTTTCTQASGIICQWENGKYVSTISTWGLSSKPRPYPAWSVVDPSNPALGVQLNYTNGDSCVVSGRSYTRTAIVSFYCADRQDLNFSVSEPSTCLFVLAMNTPLACPVGASSSSSSSGISGGAVFLIVLAIVFPLYIIIGCVYKSKNKGTTGIDSCPNVEFWRDLPGLVKDGCKFVAAGCKKKGSDTYDEL